MPLPSLLDAYRPDWVALVVLYWVIALPHRINIGTAWVAGLLLDAFTVHDKDLSRLQRFLGLQA